MQEDEEPVPVKEAATAEVGLDSSFAGLKKKKKKKPVSFFVFLYRGQCLGLGLKLTWFI